MVARGKFPNMDSQQISFSRFYPRPYNAVMRRIKHRNGRTKRRQPRRGYPHRIVAYLDADSKCLLDSALKATGENTSMFTAKALLERAQRILKNS
jgi:hypothetical protein